jgi:tripartite-type tricarboxylate transporter receptor subunit TctC
MLTAVLRGEVQLTFGSVATFFPQTKDGKLVALAVSGPARSPVAPDVPTLLEAAGSLNANARALVGTNTNWYGVLAPAGTPEDVVKKIHDGIVAALTDPGVATRLRAQGFVPDGRPPDVFAKFLQNQIDEWKQLRNEKVLE